jgi:chromosome segregation protein
VLKLKKLHILGFKSFCDRTELRFHGEGIAAIIGPNGCGKSNISDAISWVLGEQSAKTLRGSRMEDVIFAGTRDRKATGMAEVALTLIDPEVYDGPDANQPTEIEVSDELPEEEAADWDEAEVRARAAEETERMTEELQPHQNEEAEGDGEEAGPADQQAEVPGSTVVLKIRRRKFQRQIRAGEVVVTRRLFRSGDSEYLLNGKLCRLRDIQELFMGTGLGPESYALIEQGRIGQILSSRPTDRRAIIEEAAGITKFKTKKRLAEARLEDAKLNLNRVNDIFEEVARQMNSLKRQASKAERYAKLRDELRAKLRVVLAGKFAQMERDGAALEAEILALSATMREQSEQVHELESEQSERTQRGYAIEGEIRENRERLNQIKIETDRAHAQTKHNQERCVELDMRSGALTTEQAQTQDRLNAVAAEFESKQQVLDAAAAGLVAAQQAVAEAQQEAVVATNALSALESDQEQSRAAILEAVSNGSRARNQLIQAEERIASLERERGRLENEVSVSNSQVEAFGGQRGQFALEFENVSQRLTGLVDQIANARSLGEAKRREESEAKARLDSLRAEYATYLGKRTSLEAVIAEHGYSTESVRRLFQSGGLNGGRAPVGVLADFLEVENKYEAVVEDFLRDELNYVVVKSWDAADEGLRLLRSDVDGRATFLVHPDDAQAKFSFVLDEAAHHAPPNQPIVPLKNTIRVLDGFGKSLEVILPKLRDGYIVPDAGLGRELALENPDAFFLSQSGECFHNVTVTGGKQRAEGPLSMKRELRDVMRHLQEIEDALRMEETRVLTLGREIKEVTSLLERLEAERFEAEKQAMTSGHMLKQLDSEMSRVRERLALCERELQRLAVERAEQEALIGSYHSQIAEFQQRQQELEQATAAMQMEVGQMRQRRDEASHNVSERRAHAATLEERHRSTVAVCQGLEAQIAEFQGRLQNLTQQIDASAAEGVRRIAENEQLAAQLTELEAEHNATETRDGLLQLESEQLRARLGEIEEALRQARQALDAVRDRKGEQAALSAKLQSDLEYLGTTCLNELGVQRQELTSDSTIPILTGEQLAFEDEAQREMRTRLDAMGPVNMMALEEYKETAERYTFLETQRRDLLESIENTQAVIKEIDTVSREKFTEAFHKINENFQLTFRKLFGGGQAFMRLTDEENSAESGIDVVASPPGKKLQNVLLLSGGEKALTALSLLVGIFQYQPSPFCILDEVDAPLDEANIGRFTELIKEMSVKTQFVLITHSKKTMSIAPVLYGVTMQEPGVSKLVSVRFAAN